MAYCTKCGAPADGDFCTKCGAKLNSPNGPNTRAQKHGSSETPDLPASPTADSSSSANPPHTQTSAGPAAKKRSPLFWILGGCLLIIVIGIIVSISAGIFVYRKAGIDSGLTEKNPGLAVVKMLATLNPDIEVVSVDEGRGTIEMRDKETGKTVTMNLEDVKQGKIVFEDDENERVEIQARGEGNDAEMEIRSSEGSILMGSSAAAQLPAWLPLYPGAVDTGTFGISSDDGLSGSCSFKTNDSVQSVSAFYENVLEDAGFEVRKSETQLSGKGSVISLTMTDSNSQRTAQVTTSALGEGTSINLVFKDE